MIIATYRSDDAPAGFECVAHIFTPQTDVKTKKTRLAFHPVVINASTEEAAREKAQAWWDGEVEKAAARERNAVAAGMRARNRKSVTP